jgi:heat shock protein HtpX
VAATSFFEQISANRRNSFLMAAFVVALLALLGFTIGYAVSGSLEGAVAVTGLATLLGGASGAFTYFAGDSLVLAVSQAHQVDETQAPKLMNVVRELSIAANIPMPKVYVIDDSAPNAFATGRDPKHASVAITTGLLEKLDREELQGVIGHELSHVRNLDIRFSLIVAVMVGVIAILADFFLRLRSGAALVDRVIAMAVGEGAPRPLSSSSRSSWPSWRRSSAGSSSSPCRGSGSI